MSSSCETKPNSLAVYKAWVYSLSAHALLGTARGRHQSPALRMTAFHGERLARHHLFFLTLVSPGDLRIDSSEGAITPEFQVSLGERM